MQPKLQANQNDLFFVRISIVSHVLIGLQLIARVSDHMQLRQHFLKEPQVQKEV